MGHKCYELRNAPLAAMTKAGMSPRKLNIDQPPVITVVGRAFFDVGHSLKDQSKNREKASSWLRCMGNSSGDETNSSMIRVYNKAGNVIETHEHAGGFKAW